MRRRASKRRQAAQHWRRRRPERQGVSALGGRGEEIAGVSHRVFGRHGGATRTGRETTANNGRSPESPSEQEERGLEGERKLGEGEDAGRRRRPWRCSSARDEGGFPADLRRRVTGGSLTANATTANARRQRCSAWRLAVARAKSGGGAGAVRAREHVAGDSSKKEREEQGCFI